jgi:hypothetical protein
MQIKLLSLVATVFVATMSLSQGLTISPGTSFKTNAGISIVVQNGSITNNGNGDLSNSSLYMTGSGAGNVGGSSSTTVSNLYLNKAASATLLMNDLTVTNNVVFQNGLLDLNGHNLLLSPSGLLVGESETNRITGPSGGYVSITVNLNAPSGSNPGNLGAIITTARDLGSVLIQRGHQSQTNQATGKSILRYFRIQPTNNSALFALFRFTYLDAELNGLTESSLNMWRSTNGGVSWTTVASTGQSTTLNFVDINVSVFARYTLSSPGFSLTGESHNVITSDAKTGKKNEILSLALVPNPVNLQGKVLINSSTACNSELAVFTLDGKKIMQQSLYLHAGTNEAKLNTNTLSAGLYYIVLEMQDGTKNKIPFTKQ